VTWEIQLLKVPTSVWTPGSQAVGAAEADDPDRLDEGVEARERAAAVAEARVALDSGGTGAEGAERSAADLTAKAGRDTVIRPVSSASENPPTVRPTPRHILHPDVGRPRC
jgi:hypothetical protein